MSTKLQLPLTRVNLASLQDRLQQRSKTSESDLTEAAFLAQAERARDLRRARCLEVVSNSINDSDLPDACPKCSSSLLYCQTCTSRKLSSIPTGLAATPTTFGILDLEKELAPYTQISYRTDHPIQRFLTPGALFDPPLISRKGLESMNLSYSDRESVGRRLIIAEANYQDTQRESV
ncbi:uncharacterized protein MCYG_06111 [Microsporum canis CBS 113480]|uniref:Uncharacterized protein n=1 Tax=Arthroderma otae (strain ATCC MYA-4605 / CBS 113480) TaxID=554155 RepID=C5FTT9_ARTOC|nr:uncharacterized protein MCYG_06111 [Microsporum canis CBS 113480]EEQ33292.1 predicted protein [Microsporum canis CBS 113480]